MKIQLDFKQKTITLENNVSLSDFVERIQSILPDWKEWTLNTNTTIANWLSPIIIERNPNPYYPWTPLYTDQTGTITCSDTEHQYGVYNLQLN